MPSPLQQPAFSEIDAPNLGALACAGSGPPEDKTLGGCPITQGQQVLEITAGERLCRQWRVRSPGGLALVLEPCPAPADHETLAEGEPLPLDILVRFAALDEGCPVWEMAGGIVDAETGLVEFNLPEDLLLTPGIYHMQIGILVEQNLVATDSGLISVSPSLWSTGYSLTGPPSVQEIRRHLRDYGEATSLLGEYEFSTADIVSTILDPLREFNETPPESIRYTTQTFPWRKAWRDAIVAELLRSAANYYLRNKAQTRGGSLTFDERNKNAEYLALAQTYRGEWLHFVARKKNEISARGWFGRFD